MNKKIYFDYISNKLISFASNIESKGKLNLLDDNLYAENFYRDFFNKLFDWNLENTNFLKPNFEAIDLQDTTNKIIIQVSSTATADKINSSLAKPILKTNEYNGYKFKFISIAKDTSNLKKKKYKNPIGIQFDPHNDIYDIHSILKVIYNLPIDKMKIVRDFIKKELGHLDSLDQEYKLETNIAQIINILAKVDLNITDTPTDLKEYDIKNKIKFNDLISSKILIEEYKVYQAKIDNIYNQYDREGCNKSLSVLRSLNKIYADNYNNLSGDELFNKIIKDASNKVVNSINFENIKAEELEQCIEVIVVDAFIRCKIFKKPI